MEANIDFETKLSFSPRLFSRINMCTNICHLFVTVGNYIKNSVYYINVKGRYGTNYNRGLPSQITLLHYVIFAKYYCLCSWCCFIGTEAFVTTKEHFDEF